MLLYTVEHERIITNYECTYIIHNQTIYPHRFQKPAYRRGNGSDRGKVFRAYVDSVKMTRKEGKPRGERESFGERR